MLTRQERIRLLKKDIQADTQFLKDTHTTDALSEITQIVNNPELERYAVNFRAGQTIFLEGDESQDLYILVSGRVDIIKGNTKIAETSEPGSIIGEMSFLLGESRTASIKAREDIKVLRIPQKEAGIFLEKFPFVTAAISRLLAPPSAAGRSPSPGGHGFLRCPPARRAMPPSSPPTTRQWRKKRKTSNSIRGASARAWTHC